MKTKKDFNPILHSRLLHIDYDDNLDGEEKRKAQKQAKSDLINDFRKSFGLDGKIEEFVLSNKDGSDIWYYSTTHAKGSTMIMFAKWPVGLDCLSNDTQIDINKYINSDHFNQSEKQYYLNHKDPIQFFELWTAKEAFIKCYFIENNKYPDFNEFKLIERHGNIAYSNNKAIYQCNKGIGGNKYTFTICERE